MRPSNSGIATCHAVSSWREPGVGLQPASREEVVQMPELRHARDSSAGTSTPASPPASPPSRVGGVGAPLASTVARGITRTSESPAREPPPLRRPQE